MDYPNVTHVIQYGSAENRETYIHRLGRTGRAGKRGVGILVVGGKSEEREFVGRELKGLELKVSLCHFMMVVLSRVWCKAHSNTHHSSNAAK